MNGKRNHFKELLARSSSAACAPGERFVTVKKENLSSALKTIKRKGFATEVTVPTRKTSVRKIFFARNMLI